MYLKSLNIESFKHLENLHFDFTYPETHPKSGQPLNKICIIGQSATGKTSILDLIKENIARVSATEVINDSFFFTFFQTNFKGEFEIALNNDVIKVGKSTIIKNGHVYKNLQSGGGTVSRLIANEIKLLYFTAEVISRDVVNIFSRNPIDILNALSSEIYNKLQTKHKDENFVYEFSQDLNEEVWFALLYEILDYRKRFTQMASELINKGAIGDLTRLNKEYAKWAEVNKNPLESFAKHFNPILSKLNLEVDLINTEYSIPIRSRYNDEVIPLSKLSTGTIGLLLSMFPIYVLNTQKSIILVDEPERSLFPDMQIDLFSYYRNLAPDAQFIVATHSPFIAAAFEPEERFILYFTNEGKVVVKRGESPIGDDPNDILRNDFNITYYNEFGKAAYERYLSLKQQVAKENEPQEKKKLMSELAQLGDKYNF
jgi:predicted ATP-dependent endonuclease of OLD family